MQKSSDLLPVSSEEMMDTNETFVKPAEPSVQGVQSTEKVFDHADLLKRMDNDEEIIKLVVGVFLQDITERIAVQKAAIEIADFKQIIEVAHGIKGTAANLSCFVLSDYAATIEQAGETNDIETIRNVFPVLEESFIQLESILKKLLK